jgi:glyoxylase-like metal-dependent hydrolase (beta-lactamase superfamily II)
MPPTENSYLKFKSLEKTMITTEFGAAQITIINVSDLRADLPNWFAISEWPNEYDNVMHEPQAIPVQCVLIQLPHMTLLVDAFVNTLTPESPFALPNYRLPPSLLEQLAQAGVAPEEITHLVITHLHFDHYSGVTRQEEDGRYIPAFPNAQVYIGHADWHRAERQLTRPGSTESTTLAIIQQHGLLQLVEGELDLGEGVTILPAPGESPGHQIVRVQTGQSTLYILGDLYHHEVEVEQPTWIVNWADAATMTTSREALVPALLHEDAVLMASHIEGYGRIHPIPSGLKWQSLA